MRRISDRDFDRACDEAYDLIDELTVEYTSDKFHQLMNLCDEFGIDISYDNEKNDICIFDDTFHLAD